MGRKFENASGSKSLIKIAEKSISETNTKILKNIPLELLDPNPDNEKIFNMDRIDDLSQHIEKEGFHGAIEVWQKPDGRYEILAGNRRFAASRENNESTIPCVIEEIYSEIEKAEYLLASNLHTRVLNPMDYARAIQYYEEKVLSKDFQGNKRAEAAKFFDISESQIYKYKVLIKLIPALQKKAEKKIVAYSALFKLVSMDILIQEKINKKFDDFIQENGSKNLTRDIIENIIESIKNDENKLLEEKENFKKQKTAFLKKWLKTTNSLQDLTQENTQYLSNEEKQELLKQLQSIMDIIK